MKAIKFIVGSVLAFISAVALTGCDQSTSDAPHAASAQASATQQTPPPEPPAPPPPPRLSLEDWKRAVESTYNVSDKKQDDNGVTEFYACFDCNDKERVGVAAKGKYDGFRKVTHLIPVWQNLARTAGHYAHKSGVYSFVAIIDCKEPLFVISPVVEAKNWLFMNKVALMADGEVVLEHEFDNVDRDHDDGDVTESAVWILDDRDIEGIEKFISSQKQIARISGKKGYITVNSGDVAKSAKETLTMFNNINQALKAVHGPRCTQEK
jgi:hypothetical protein